MKIIKSKNYVKQLLASEAKCFDPETWAEAVASEMKTIDNRAIAREKAKENLEKDSNHYKVSK
jgi:hypothetical protein